jgi:hypothetical protein
MALKDQDIRLAARAILEVYGADAETTAAQRADKAVTQNDPQGETLWKRIAAAVHEMQNKAQVGEPAR